MSHNFDNLRRHYGDDGALSALEAKAERLISSGILEDPKTGDHLDLLVAAHLEFEGRVLNYTGFAPIYDCAYLWVSFALEIIFPHNRRAA